MRYVHAEDYFGEVVQAFLSKTFEAFKRTYRTVDVLLLDDFDFFDKKSRTQEEFYYALIHMIENRKQVIVTCKTCPEALSGFDERLLSRFVGGLVVPMEAPELALRVDILIQKAESAGITLTKAKAFHLARHLSANMYELEGAVNKLLAYVRFYNDPNGEAAVNAALTIMAGEIDDCEDEVAACIDQ